MPTRGNIRRPITLLGQGRSGTSLTQRILGAHPDVDIHGETASLLWGVWYATAPGGEEPLRAVPRQRQRQKSGRVVRAAFLAAHPPRSDPPAAEWMHKPIGYPWAAALIARNRSPEIAAAWYWTVLAKSFPQSRNITILRHPYDVMLSQREFNGTPLATTWNAVVRLAALFQHGDADLPFAVSYRRLVETPEAEIRRLLAHLGLGYDPACLAATGQLYVPDASTRTAPLGASDRPARGFSRQESWGEIDRAATTREDRETVAALWARFGEPLEL